MGRLRPLADPPLHIASLDGDESRAAGAPADTASQDDSSPVNRPGPATAFEHFYRSNYPTVTRLAYSLCGSIAVAEELAQDAFVSAHARWRRISRFDRPDLWVRRVVINRSISFRRKQASERTALERVPTESDRDGEPKLADEELWTALRGLSPRQAEVIALVYVEDRPIAEVAEILRLGEETIRTHLKRGRAALHAKLVDSREERVP